MAQEEQRSLTITEENLQSILRGLVHQVCTELFHDYWKYTVKILALPVSIIIAMAYYIVAEFNAKVLSIESRDEQCIEILTSFQPLVAERLRLNHLPTN